MIKNGYSKKKIYFWKTLIKYIIMKNELLEEFKVEELEKRFEMGWTATKVEASIKTEVGTVKVNIPLEQTPPPTYNF